MIKYIKHLACFILLAFMIGRSSQKDTLEDNDLKLLFFAYNHSVAFEVGNNKISFCEADLEFNKTQDQGQTCFSGDFILDTIRSSHLNFNKRYVNAICLDSSGNIANFERGGAIFSFDKSELQRNLKLLKTKCPNHKSSSSLKALIEQNMHDLLNE